MRVTPATYRMASLNKLVFIKFQKYPVEGIATDGIKG